MLFTMLAAVSGCVSTNHTISATKRNPTILLRFTDNHRSAPGEGPLTLICTAPAGSAVSGARARTERSDDRPYPGVPCVGGLAYDADGRLLLDPQRATNRAAGCGRCQGVAWKPGESDADAVVREMAEETGLVVRARRAGRHGAPRAVTRSPTTGAPSSAARCAPGDDATDARWCDAATLTSLPLVPLLYDTLREWDALPR